MSDDESLHSLLKLSVELVTTLKEAEIEAAKERHPSSLPAPTGVMLYAADRCDACPAAAAYRVAKKPPADEVFYVAEAPTLDFCVHHFRKNFPPMVAQGRAVVGGNPSVIPAA